MSTVSNYDKFEKSYSDEIREYINIKDFDEAKVVLEMQMDHKKRKLFVHQKNILKTYFNCMEMRE